MTFHTHLATGKIHNWAACKCEPDARPLVVIDPEDAEQLGRLHDAWTFAEGEGARGRDIASLALREFARPTPPKPKQPFGLGAVVEDAQGQRFVRACTCGGPDWRTEGNEWRSEGRKWDDIDVVRVLSEGVTS